MQKGATPEQPERLCRGCGNPVARDHYGDLFCGPCRIARRSYNPACDPDFADTLLALFQANPRQRLHVYRELGIEHCGLAAWTCVQNHIRRLRRHGHVIIGRHDGTYEYLGPRPTRNARASRIRRRP